MRRAWPPPRPGAVVAVAVLAVFVHGLQAGRLGLYWDDAYQLMQPFQALGYDPVRFILSDSSRYLPEERPLGYFAFAIARAAFAWDVTAVHGLLVALVAIDAVALALLARRVLDEDWFVFAAGAVFVVYPLSPLHTLWPATVHYHIAYLFALTAAIAVHSSLTTPTSRNSRLATAGGAYAASLLTHEVFAAIPVAFALLHIFVVPTRPAAMTVPLADAGQRRRTAMAAVGVLAAVFGAYAMWRLLVLPAYGATSYATPGGANVVALLRKTVLGAVSALFPWREVALYLRDANPGLGWPVAAVVVGASVGLAAWTLREHRRDTGPGVAAAPANPAACVSPGYAATVGVALLAGGTAAVAVSPVHLVLNFGPSWTSRANFVALPGVALAVPAVLLLLARLARRMPLLLAIIGLAGLIGFAFVGAPGNSNIFTYRSHAPVVLGRYSAAYALLLVAYGTLVVVALLAVTFLVKRAGSPDRHAGGASMSAAGRHSVPAAMAAIAVVGALLHFTSKEAFIAEWNGHTRMLRQLSALAPSVADDTFVLLVDRRPDRGSTPYSTHEDISAYLLGIYGNWSVTGNTLPHVRFHQDGIESTYHGRPARWFPRGHWGPFLTHATEPLPRIGYDRVVMFEYDGTVLRALPELSVVTVEGHQRRVRTNAHRLEAVRDETPRIWQHVMRP